MRKAMMNIKRAIEFAARKHDGQYRKGTDIPYIAHLANVLFIASRYTNDEDTCVAGPSHDYREDVIGSSFEELEKEFNKNVAQIVREVSEDKDPANKERDGETWSERKREHIRHLESASYGAMIISAADKIDNLMSMIIEYEKEGEAYWNKFNAPKEKIMWYYENVLAVLKRRLKNDIVGEFKSVLSEAKRIVRM